MIICSKQKKITKNIDQSLSDIRGVKVEVYPLFKWQPNFRRKSLHEKPMPSFAVHRTDQSNERNSSRDPFFNIQRITPLNLNKNFDYMDPCDVTYQLNEMMGSKQFAGSKQINRIHQRSGSRPRTANRVLQCLSKTVRIN